MNGRIQPHNERPAAVWSAGGKDYNEISRGIADSIEHCVLRLNPQPGERILDLSTGTGWTSRVVARRGASVIGVDIAHELLDAARAQAQEQGLAIDYQLGDAENLPFENGEFDAVVSTCGVMFASRPEAAAGELARVCRKGGRTFLKVPDVGAGVPLGKDHRPLAIAYHLPVLGHRLEVRLHIEVGVRFRRDGSFLQSHEVVPPKFSYATSGPRQQNIPTPSGSSMRPPVRLPRALGFRDDGCEQISMPPHGGDAHHRRQLSLSER